MLYSRDSGLEGVAKPIIEAHHPTLKQLKIEYLFRPEAAITDGKVIAGRAIRVDDRNWAIHKTDAIIEIAQDVWEGSSKDFRNALMDHELSHLKVEMEDADKPEREKGTNRVKFRLKHHDIEEFSGVLKRYGDYHEALRTFLEAFAESKGTSKAAVVSKSS